MNARTIFIFVFAAVSMLFDTAARGSTSYLILCGSGGEKEFQTQFQDWGRRLQNVLVQKLGASSGSVTVLGEPGEDAIAGGRLISLEGIRSALNEMRGTLTAQDDLFIFLIGHGSALKQESKFQIPGPDISSVEFKSLLSTMTARRVAVINATSGSAGFINDLSGANRIICSATKSATEMNVPRFMEHFIQALEEGSADQNRDERISILEACAQADSLTQAWYAAEGLLATEHALLDDNGDGKGTRLADARSGRNDERPDDHKTDLDGAIAATFFLKDFSFPASTPPELASRYLGLLDRIERLKLAKSKMPADEFSREMEEVLIQAATAHRDIRRAGGIPDSE